MGDSTNARHATDAINRAMPTVMCACLLVLPQHEGAAAVTGELLHAVLVVAGVVG